jgi:flagellar basal-body rod modification protein FlgD
MSTVQSLQAASAANNPANAASSTSTNQLQATTQSFLSLFMAQLQNQDPLDPQSGSDMVGELAQLTTVQQQSQTNTSLQQLVNGQSSTTNAGMANLVGRSCDAAAGSFSIASTGGTPPPLQLSATSAMSGASVVITDANGNTVDTIPVPNGTSATVQWNGCNSSGVPVPAGSYNVAVQNGNSSAAITAQWQGTVTAVQMNSSGTQLQMGDLLVDPSTISSIGAAATSAITPSAISAALATAASTKQGATP